MFVDENNNIVELNKVLYDFMGEMSYKIVDLISMIKGVIENIFFENINKISEIEIYNKILKINIFFVEYKKNNIEYIVVFIKDIINDKIVEVKLFRENKMIFIG